jgi:hypothetical protein
MMKKNYFRVWYKKGNLSKVRYDHSPRTDFIAHTQKNGDVNLNTLLTHYKI